MSSVRAKRALSIDATEQNGQAVKRERPTEDAPHQVADLSQMPTATDSLLAALLDSSQAGSPVPDADNEGQHTAERYADLRAEPASQSAASATPPPLDFLASGQLVCVPFLNRRLNGSRAQDPWESHSDTDSLGQGSLGSQGGMAGLDSLNGDFDLPSDDLVMNHDDYEEDLEDDLLVGAQSLARPGSYSPKQRQLCLAFLEVARAQQE